MITTMILLFVVGYLFIALEHKTKIDKSAVALLMAGAIWTVFSLLGNDPKIQHELVDQLGGINDAIEAAADRAKLEDYRIVKYPNQTDFLTSILSNVNPDRYIYNKIESMFGDFGESLLFLKNIDKIDRLQARMPFDIILE